MKSSIVLQKLMNGISIGGGNGNGGEPTTPPEIDPESITWVDFESNGKTIINSAFYKTENMEILGHTTIGETDVVHAGVFDGLTEMYKIKLKSGNTVKNIFIPQQLAHIEVEGASGVSPCERLYYDEASSKYLIDKCYDRFVVKSTDIGYANDRQGTETVYFTIASLTQAVISSKYMTNMNNKTFVVGNYTWATAGDLSTIYQPAPNIEGVFLGYNVCGIRVKKTRLTEEGFATDKNGVMQWLDKLKSDGKPLTLYLPLITAETVETSVKDLDMITYEGQNRLEVNNGNGIIKCKYPTI